MKHLTITALLGLLAPLSACTLVFGKDEPLPCADLPGQRDPAPPLRNPDTLTCDNVGGGGSGCDSGCGPCGGAGDGAPIAYPTWAQCGHACEALDEGSCIAAPGCRAAYDYACQTGNGPCTALQPFLGCYPVDTTGPIAGSCLGLGGWDCSQHDDCAALYETSGPSAVFAECVPEPGRPWGTCDGPVLCDALPPLCPVGSVPGISDGCYTGVCIPSDECGQARPCELAAGENECLANASCTPLYVGGNCTCTPTSCVCETRDYYSCAAN
ncbi:MAG: hypothetical protein KBG28_30670 [Kofleriaceae bacterium]|nr:hypothetical protein [Kofleriaceae bacterium]